MRYSFLTPTLAAIIAGVSPLSLPAQESLVAAVADLAPVPTMAYQGRLVEGGVSANGARVFTFAILDASGLAQWTSGNVTLTVSDGLYSVVLGAAPMPAMPSAMLGKAGLKLHVTISGQALTPDVDIVPALQARSAWELTGPIAGDVTGTQNQTLVMKLQGTPLDLTTNAPSNGQALVFLGGKWVPSTVLGTAGATGATGAAGATGAMGPTGATGATGLQGPAGLIGLTGLTGAKGDPGAAGLKGLDGRTVLSGTGSPVTSAATGVAGDFYLDTAANLLYGPKVGADWTGLVGLSLVGPAGPSGAAGGATGPAGPTGPMGASGPGGATGATGATGAQGVAGAAGQTLVAGSAALSGATDPGAGLGKDGDFYINTTTNTLWGPRASGVWPAAGVSLIGPQGAQGLQGAAGPTGTAGIAGATGPAGPTGPTGSTGATGPAGSTGAMGAAGATGATGPSGATGATGTTGPQGVTGTAGQTVVAGNAALSGATDPGVGIGVDGDFYINTTTNTLWGPRAGGVWPAAGVSLIGPQGAQGLQGTVGAVGSTGATGAVGAQGPAGPQGAQGLQGAQGSAGVTGAAGATGATGATGLQGLQGAKGDTGTAGAVGPQGVAGVAGTTGATGPQGLQGAKGDTGVQGPQGLQGVPGSVGPEGAQGATGAPGQIVVAGKAVLSGGGDPGVDLGIDGDFYLNTGTNVLWGPKAAGVWPAVGVSMVGPQGPQGSQGLTGAAGAAGSQGAQGVQGPAGPQGSQGVKGDAGSQGGQGVKGDSGSQGVQGTKGDTGATGTQGLMGDIGATGSQGVQGLQGAKGDAGPQGVQGVKGDLGATGAKGDTGATGAQGPQGLKGDLGTTGGQGVKGDTGAQGIQGLKGDTGAGGAQGVAGPAGGQGVAGSQGLKGDTGTQGSQGVKGDTGAQGIQGLKGDTGATGPQGLLGLQGVKGDTGNTGAAGQVMVAGSAALSGATDPAPSLGVDGNFYINTTTNVLWGPKAAGAWPMAGVSMVGPQGTQGTQGVQGTKGDTGLTGAAGATGPQGTQGLQGGQGTKGDTGLTGATGATGTQGTQGLQGLTGLTGATGATGPTGPQGTQGTQGVQGVKGDTGTTGAAGPQGIQGVQGSKGDLGAAGGTGAQGLQGLLGLQGETGPTGVTGTSGQDGRTVLSGSANPAEGIGANGDFYLNTTTNTLFGPKAAGAWPTGVSLVGATGAEGAAGAKGNTGAAGVAGAQGLQGEVGPAGAAGSNGVDGRTVLSGSANPATDSGAIGDFYLNTTTSTLFGPKVAGAWPTGVSLVGPAGAEGAAGAKGDTGAAGVAGSTGATGATGAAGASPMTLTGSDVVFSGGALAIGTDTPAATALLDLSSTTKGFLPPRMTAAQRTAITTPAAGLLVYQADGAAGLYQFNGSTWTGPFGTSSTTGTVTQVSAGTGLTGGDITHTGTLGLANTAVTAGTYTRATVTVDAQGRLTAASSGAAVPVAEVSGLGSAATLNAGTSAGNLVQLDGSGKLPVLDGSQLTGVLGSVASDANSSTAAGSGALAVSTGHNNAAFGYQALQANTTAPNNTAVGSQALQANLTGSANTATGAQALGANTTGFANTATGAGALASSTGGIGNAAFGWHALSSATTPSSNAAFGSTALASATTGASNVSVGTASLYNLTTGSNNTALGYQAGNALSTGGSNLLLGAQAGSALGTGGHNIDLANTGLAADANTLRLGTAYDAMAGTGQSRAFVAGIRGVAVAGGQTVMIDANGQLGSTTGGGGTVTSVGLALPGLFSVTNSPVTGTGTLTAALTSQSANLVLAGPASGAGTAPSFRSLVPADIPVLDTSKLTTGILPLVRGGTGSATGSITGSTELTFAAGGTNQSVTLTPSGTGAVALGSVVGIGTATPDTAAALDITSTTKGFLPPRLTTAQRTAMGTGSIAAPVNGLVVFDTGLNALLVYDATSPGTWNRLAASTTTDTGAVTNFSGTLVGDVTGTQGRTVVSTVGDQTAADVAAGAVLANAATDSNTVSALVRRDAAGGFTAGVITGSLAGNVSGTTGAFTGAVTAGSLTGTGALTVAAGGSSQNVTLAPSAGGSTLLGGSVGINTTGDAPLASAALDITSTTKGFLPPRMSTTERTSIGAPANGLVVFDTDLKTLLIFDATAPAWRSLATTAGGVTNFSGTLAGDVTGTQGATTVATVGTSTAAQVHAAELLANAATNAGTASTLVKRDGSGDFAAGNITASLTGSVSGSVVGNVTGNVTGSITGATGAFTGAVTAASLTGTGALTIAAGDIAQNVTIAPSTGGNTLLGGAVGIGTGTNNPAASAALEVISTTQGFLPPRLTTAQRTAMGTSGIAAPANGLMVFDTDLKTLMVYDNTGAGTWQTFVNSGGQISNATTAVNFTGNLVGDVTGTQGATVVGKVNGVSLAGLATGLLKNTTSTGVPSIAVAGTDYLAPAGSGAALTSMTKDQVGLANVDNTSDASKPISSATSTALALKAPLASPTFTGTLALGDAAGIGTVTPAATAALEIASTTKGFLAPRMTAAQVAAIGSPATGLLVYQTDGTSGFYFYNGSAWAGPFGTSSAAGTVTNVTPASGSPITVSSGTSTPVIGITQATGSVDGYLAATDFATFSAKAGLDSPTFTGTPAAPTATAGTNSTQLATTAFVASAVGATSASNISTGTLAVARGGTGSGDATIARTNLGAAAAGANADITGLTGTIDLAPASVTQAGELRFQELASNGTSYLALKGPDALDTNFTLTLPATAGSLGQVLSTNGSGTLSWVNAASGAVTSVGLALPDLFSVSNSPVTGAGTLTATLNSQTAGTVLAAPAGSAGSPGFRSLAASDIPALDASKIAAGLLPVTRGGTGAGSAAEALTALGAAASGANADITALTGLTNQTSLTLKPIDSSNTGELRLLELAAGGTDYVALKAPDALAGAVTLTLPSALGSAGQVLRTDANGILSWVSPAAGSVTSVTASDGPITVATTTTTPVITLATVTVPYGGTGATSLTGYVKGNGSSAMTAATTIPGVDISGDISGNAATATTAATAASVTNGVYTLGDQTIAGTKTFSSPIAGSITGNSATVTNGVYSNAANTLTKGEQAIAIEAADKRGLVIKASGGQSANLQEWQDSSATVLAKIDSAGRFVGDGSQLTGTVPAATTAVSFSGSLSGDVTGTQAATVVGKLNRVSLAGLDTGILKNTTVTGVPSIAVAADFPVLNQDTTGNAATATAAGSVTNGVYTVGDQTIAGTKTFSSGIAGNLTGNVTGDVTGAVTGNVTGNLTGNVTGAAGLTLAAAAGDNSITLSPTGTGGVGIGAAPEASALLALSSSTKGFLPPRLTTTERTAMGTGSIAAPATGLVVYDTTVKDLFTYDGSAWVRPGSTGAVASVAVGGAPLSVSGTTTPTISIAAAGSGQAGYLTAADWNRFDGKGSGTVTGVTVGGAPLSVSGTTAPVISIAQASGSGAGYLSKDDWTTFNTAHAAAGYLKADGSVPAGGTLNMNSNRITGLAAPTGTTDAATKAYVDSLSGGLVWRESVVSLAASAPATPVTGARYIVTVAWGGGNVNQIATWSGTDWSFASPLDKDAVFATALSNGYVFNGTAWSQFNSGATYTFGAGLTNTANTITLATGGVAAANLAGMGASSGQVLRYSGGVWGPASLSGFAASGANSDITSLSALSTALTVAQGGTGSTTGSITGSGALTFAAGGTNQSVTLTPSAGGSTQLGGSVGINTTGDAPHASAMLDLTSTAKGLLVPRMTAAQVAAISTPATGLLVYQTDSTPGFYAYTGSAWSGPLSTSTGSVTSVSASAPLSATSGATPTISLTGTVPVANGGTGTGSAPNPGGIIFGSSGTAFGSTAAGTAGYLLQSGGSGAPSWLATVPVTRGGTGLSTYAVGDLLYASGTGTLTGLADVATGKALISGGVGAAPSWGQVALATGVTGTLPVANGGTGAATAAANLVFASPNGSTGAPSFRSLVATDVPSLAPLASPTFTGTVTAPTFTATTGFVGALTGNASTATTAAGLSATLAIASGGTGATTATAARTALLPTQTGNTGRFLTTSGTDVSWSALTSSQWATSGSTISYSAGNVGIGTTTPGALLSFGTAANEQQVLLYETTGSNHRYGFGIATSELRTFIPDVTGSTFMTWGVVPTATGTGYTERMRFTSAGSLGIGTTPAYKLDVAGDINIASGSAVYVGGFRSMKIDATSANVLYGKNAGGLSLGFASGQGNTAIGHYALGGSVTSGTGNTVMGAAALANLSGTSSDNVGIGSNTLYSLSTGDRNTAYGTGAGFSGTALQYGSNNVYIGFNSGASAAGTSGTPIVNEVVLGASATGMGSNTTTIGNISTAKTYIKGVANAAGLGTTLPVVVDTGTGQLGTAASAYATLASPTFTGTPAAPTATAGTNTTQLATTAFVSTAVSSSTNAGNLASGTLLAARMPALTGDVTSTAGTVATTVGKINGVALAGLATGILKNTTTTGVPSIAVAADFPTLNQNTTGTAAGLSATLAIASGGTGATSAGAALTALGAASAGANSTITSLSGLTTALSVTQGGTGAKTVIDARTNLGLTIGTAAGNVVALDATTAKLPAVDGSALTNVSATGVASFGTSTSNTKGGTSALNVNTGSFNTAFGASALLGNLAGNNNAAFGYQALDANTGGGNNTAMGYSALGANITGSGNTALGAGAGSLITSSNNIDIGHVGVAGEAGTIRIGTAATQTATYIAGITGVTPAGTPQTVVIDSNGQLGTAAAGAAGTGSVTSVTAASGGPITVATTTTTPVITLGTVPVTYGGTGTSTAPSQGGIIYGSSTSAFASTAAGTSGYLLQSGGTGAPSWLATVPVTRGGTGSSTTFTQGAVVFAGASGTYSQDASYHFWDATNHRLGIGNAAPFYPLDVGPASWSATGSATAALFRNGNNSDTYSNVQLAFGYGNNTYQNNLRSRHTATAKAGNALDFYVWNWGVDATTTMGSKQVLTLDGTGNVGIGTTTPGALLSFGTVTNAQQVLLYETSTSGNMHRYGFGMQTSELRTFIPDATGTFMTWGSVPTATGTGYTERMRLTTAGSLGIGLTPNASYKLDVNGDVNIPTGSVYRINGVAINSGTVSSVGLSLPSLFTVTGSPVTTSGTLSATLASQTANYVFAAPNGAAGAPAFRALVAADLPASLTSSTTGTAAGVSSFGTSSTRGGSAALNATNTSSYNTAFGSSALLGNNGGSYNSAFGALALQGNTTGNYNAAFGANTLQANTTGSSNTGFGHAVMYTNSTGANNAAYGYQALYYNNASNNSAFGYQALVTNTSGTQNAAFGTSALYLNSTASNNAAFGYSALANNTAADNAAFGNQAMQLTTTGAQNTAMGSQALYSNLTGTVNAAFGYKALYANTGSYNTAFGPQAMLANTSGAYNAAFGVNALAGNTTGNYSAAFGYYALSVNTGANNTGLGFEALQNNTSGTQNSAVGSKSLFGNTTASNNTATGYYALLTNTTGAQNTAIGSQALYSNTISADNAALGYNALYANTGAQNTAVGSLALDANTTGATNTAVGYNALGANTTGGNNTALGAGAGSALTTGSNNIDIGHAGVAGEGSTIRIGTAGTQTATYIAGINGVTPGVASPKTVVIDSNGQLGTATSVSVASGGTGTATAPTQGGVIYAASTSAYGSTAAGTAGQVMVANGTSAPTWSSTAPLLVTVNAQTGTTYTLAATDANAFITLNNASAITLTLPPSLATGFQCTVAQLGAGTVGLAAGSGVTIVSTASNKKFNAQGSGVTLIVVAANTWMAFGDMN